MERFITQKVLALTSSILLHKKLLVISHPHPRQRNVSSLGRPHAVYTPDEATAVDFADLAIIDLAKYATPEGKAELVQDVRNAMSTVGFFYVINHGYTQEQRLTLISKTRRIFDIAEIPFTVSDQEKQKYVGKMKETGSYQGYKLRQYWHVDAGVRDQIEQYNMHTDVNTKEHPEALRPFLPEIDDFARHNHFNVLLPLLRLLALGLELPEETFVEQHTFGSPLSDTWSTSLTMFATIRDAHIEILSPHDEVVSSQVHYPRRCLKSLPSSYPRSSSDEEKTKNVWLKGHTDFGSLTLLWSQPVSALQIMNPEGQWKWVKHIDNALVVNAGEALEYISGRFYKGTIHRVHQPPIDQRDLTRLGVFFFGLFNDDIKLVPLEQSPVLQRIEIVRRTEDSLAPTMGTYRKARIAAYGQTTLKQSAEKGVEEEQVAGVVIRHYN
ncbi:hypothetical protein DXG01_000647 [Tephrocybe rancida]|nr:hypothetical protein DXG01_000647 [Tephrocybe rancida]